VQDRTPAPGSKEEKRKLRIAYLVLGGMIGLLIAFFGPTIIILLTRFLGGPDLAHAEGGGELWTFIIVIGPIIGAIAGYFIGKRKDFTMPIWMG